MKIPVDIENEQKLPPNYTPLFGGPALLQHIHNQLKPFDIMKIALNSLTIEQLNELSAEIRKTRKRLKYDDRAKELAK